MPLNTHIQPLPSHCFLACIFSGENCVIIFPPLSVVFSSLIIMYLGVVFFVFMLLGFIKYLIKSMGLLYSSNFENFGHYIFKYFVHLITFKHML